MDTWLAKSGMLPLTLCQRTAAASSPACGPKKKTNKEIEFCHNFLRLWERRFLYKLYITRCVCLQTRYATLHKRTVWTGYSLAIWIHWTLLLYHHENSLPRSPSKRYLCFADHLRNLCKPAKASWYLSRVMLCMQGNFRFGISPFVCLPRGEVLNRVLYGRLCPEAQPFTLYIPFLIEKSSLSHTFYWQMKLFDMPSLELSIPLNCRKFIVF